MLLGTKMEKLKKKSSEIVENKKELAEQKKIISSDLASIKELLDGFISDEDDLSSISTLDRALSCDAAIIESQNIENEKERKETLVETESSISALEDNLNKDPLRGSIGIGHTRWATHGEPSDVNSHPHFNMDKTIAVVHNGIIENYHYACGGLKFMKTVNLFKLQLVVMVKLVKILQITRKYIKIYLLKKPYSTCVASCKRMNINSI